MKRQIQLTLVLVAVLVAGTMLSPVGAQVGLWVSTATGTQTGGTVSITNSGGSALSVTGTATAGTFSGSHSGSGASLTGIPETAITDGAIFPRLAANDTFTGMPTFTGAFTSGNVGGTGGSISAYAPTSSAITMRQIGRPSDETSLMDWVSNNQATQFMTLAVNTTDIVFTTASTRPFTFSGGRINTNTAQPGFLAFNSVGDSGVTNGSTIEFDTEVYDDAGNFNAATDQFTAPVTGRYQLALGVSTGCEGIDWISLVTSNRAYIAHCSDHAAYGLGGVSLTVFADMDVNDVAYVTVNGSTGPWSVGGGSDLYTFFSGRLVP